MAITFPGESAEYRAARDRLLQKEIEERRAMEAVAAARRELPKGGKVPQDYVFDGLSADGKPVKIKLSDLFAPGKDTLVLYNFMFPRSPQDPRPGLSEGATAKLPREDQPCPSCVAFIDQLDGAARHFEAAGFNFAAVAKTSLDRLSAFARERGWKNLRLLSSAQNSFKRDYHAETPEGEQLPLMSVFHRDVFFEGRSGAGSAPQWHARTALDFDGPDAGGAAGEVERAIELWREARPGGLTREGNRAVGGVRQYWREVRLAFCPTGSLPYCPISNNGAMRYRGRDDREGFER
jgi:predicted dithiol-disulfide oxidoreductase (DUF899 family)